MKKLFCRIGILAGLFAVACSPSPEVYDLTCEGLAEPLAIDSAQPHFSWKVASAAPTAQFAYEIQVGSKPAAADLWDSGRTESADQVMVLYAGAPLVSRQQAWWRVRVWNAHGKASRWSAPQRFGIGVIGDDALKGEYIGAVPGDGRAPLLRKSFDAPALGRGSSALLHVNSLGYHEAYINGTKISDAVLSPAVSQLDKRSLTVTCDVTRLLKKGTNEIVLWTSPGWYKKDTFEAVYDGPLVKVELDILRDGNGPERAPFALLWTDSTWEGAWSGYRDYDSWRPGHFGGEVIDARVVPQSLRKKDLDKLEWGPVAVVGVEGIVATPQMCEPCVVQETVQAVSVEADGEGSWIVDFGRVMNAMPDLRLPVLPEGHRVTASFTDHIMPDGKREIYSRNEYIASGSKEGDRFADRFNHHVFRYIILDSLPQAPSLKDCKARRMRTDFKKSATFTSSDEELNRIHDMVAYTLDNLAFDGYMVDCANIERLGYGGDGNASTLTLQEMAAVSPLYLNWLQAWIDAQQEDGGLPHTAPCPYKAGGGPYWCSFIVQAPWRTYMSYGDDRLLARCWPAMLQWIGYVDQYAEGGMLLQRNRWPGTDYRTWYLGDWAAPPEYVDVMLEESVDLVNNCALCQTYADLVQIARKLDKAAEAERFAQRLADLKANIHRFFFHPEDSSYGTGSQIDMAYPLLVGAVPDSLAGKVRDRLFERTATVYDAHLVTGLVGVPILTEWASLAGECDFFYGLLKTHGYPGYLYMLDNGATGTWEHWDAERSRLHNCFNGIGSWFYQALGGIIPDEPGYRHIKIEPQIPEGLDWVRVTQETPYGPIVVRREGRKLHFELPVGITATVAGREYGCGRHDIEM
jgi:alpha-L-rhamnosidase